MSIDLAAALEVKRLMDELKIKQNKIHVLCFSEQVLCFSSERFFDITKSHSNTQNHEEFLKSLGATKVTTTYFRSGQKKGRVSLDLNQDVKHRFFEKFDIVLDMGVIQHCASPLSVLNHCAYYVKPGGYIIHNTFIT